MEPQPGASGGPGRGDRTEPSYYDVSILKRPVWKWEIAHYFFRGGLSGGAYLLTRVADRFSPSDRDELRRTGSMVAFAASLPCAPLLIKDLGGPPAASGSADAEPPGPGQDQNS